MDYTNKTIWINDNEKDTYVEFVGSFAKKNKNNVILKAGYDGHIAVYINDELAFFGASADYPWFRLYNKVDVTKYCSEHNDIRIVVWHPGNDSQTYIKNKPGVAFAFEQDENILLESGPHILARRNKNYKNGYCKNITYQLGFSFYYDNTITQKDGFSPSLESEEEYVFHERKTGYLKLGDRAEVICSKLESDTWVLYADLEKKESKSETEKLELAGKKQLNIEKNDSYCTYLIDLKEEVVGFIELDFDSYIKQEVIISYGEHLVDGRVQRFIDGRDFSVEFKADKGHNEYLNPFRRIAGRYLEIECQSELDIKYIGIRPTDRAIIEKKRKFSEEILQKIYDVSVNTLKKCMHEHYEDCPWREQAMYTLDSRNQMLCGYYAFDDVEFIRENLKFIGKGQREDGLLSLCFPAGLDLPIPFFSLVYIMQLQDYLMHTNDYELITELKPIIDRIKDTFADRIDEEGLIPNFSEPCWNFYEWTEGSANGCDMVCDSEGKLVKKYDLILNCMYVYFCMVYEKLYNVELDYVDVKSGIMTHFYNEDKGLFRLSTSDDLYSQLGNSFAILIGLGSKELAEKIIDEDLIEVTLSMHTFYYDALLSIDEKYKNFVIEDIKKKYGFMLGEGATTFWETAKGWQDFENAGSLCHGWSAIPVYYLSKYADDMI